MPATNERNESQKKSIRGFAAMDAEKQRAIASKGGRAAHEQGVAHQWTREEARIAGKKGGSRKLTKGRSSLES